MESNKEEKISVKEMRNNMTRDAWVRNVMRIYPNKTKEETESLHDKIFPKWKGIK